MHPGPGQLTRLVSAHATPEYVVPKSMETTILRSLLASSICLDGSLPLQPMINDGASVSAGWTSLARRGECLFSVSMPPRTDLTTQSIYFATLAKSTLEENAGL
jgi:hypothetical protein